MRSRIGRASHAGRASRVLGALFVVASLPSLGGRAQATGDGIAESLDVEVVNVDVIVTDAKANPVLSLGREDFELRVDGRTVPIEYFAAPRAAPPTASAEARDAATPPPESAPNPPEEGAPLQLVLFVDQTALENRARHETVAELRRFLAAQEPGATRISVAVFEQQLRVLQLPTASREEVDRALVELERRPSLGRLGNGERMQLEHEIRTFGQDSARFGPSFAIAEWQRIEQEIGQWAEQQIDRQARSVAALARTVDALAAADGRKAVVLATAGIEVHPGRPLFAALDQQRGVATSTDANRSPSVEAQSLALAHRFEEMVQAAQNARVAFYTISPTARPPADNSAEFGSAGPNAYRPLPRDAGPVEAAASVARLAGATGGSTFQIGDGLHRRLEAVAADFEATYSLGFSTGAEAGEGDHRIEVRTLRPGLEVRHRESFRRRTAPDRAASALAAAVTFGQVENPLAITLQAGDPRPAEKRTGTRLVPIAVGMPLRLLSLVPSGEGRAARVSIRVAIQAANGRLFEGPPARIPIVVPEAEVERAMVSSWYYRAELRLAPGPQRIAVVVLDEISGVQSTVFTEVEIPKAE